MQLLLSTMLYQPTGCFPKEMLQTVAMSTNHTTEATVVGKGNRSPRLEKHCLIQFFYYA